MVIMLEAFLFSAAPVWGLGSVAGGDGTISTAITGWPGAPMIVAGIIAGLLNALRALRTLWTEPPREGVKA